MTTASRDIGETRDYILLGKKILLLRVCLLFIVGKGERRKGWGWWEEDFCWENGKFTWWSPPTWDISCPFFFFFNPPILTVGFFMISPPMWSRNYFCWTELLSKFLLLRCIQILLSLNPLHLDSRMQILHTVLYTFLKVLTGRICQKIKSFSRF